MESEEADEREAAIDHRVVESEDTDERETAIDHREADLAMREAQLATREANLATREMQLAIREAHLAMDRDEFEREASGRSPRETPLDGTLLPVKNKKRVGALNSPCMSTPAFGDDTTLAARPDRSLHGNNETGGMPTAVHEAAPIVSMHAVVGLPLAPDRPHEERRDASDGDEEVEVDAEEEESNESILSAYEGMSASHEGASRAASISPSPLVIPTAASPRVPPPRLPIAKRGATVHSSTTVHTPSESEPCIELGPGWIVQKRFKPRGDSYKMYTAPGGKRFWSLVQARGYIQSGGEGGEPMNVSESEREEAVEYDDGAALDNWAQCDECMTWRKLPPGAPVPAKTADSPRRRSRGSP